MPSKSSRFCYKAKVRNMSGKNCSDCLRFSDCEWVGYLAGFKDAFFWVTDEILDKVMNRGFAWVCPYYTENEEDL